MLSSAKIYLYGLILGVSGNTLKVPFIGEDVTLRAKANTEQEVGLEKELLKAVNAKLPLLEQISGVEVSASVSSGSISCDLSGIMELDPTEGSNEEVQTALVYRVRELAEAYKQDENGRWGTTPINVSNFDGIELKGDVILNEEGAYMYVNDVTLSNGKTAHADNPA